MNEKTLWLNDVRAIACIMVVVLHTAAIYVLKTDDLFWEIGNIFDSFSRVCVPLFFMISGYLFFFEKQVKIKNFNRLIIPLVFYSGVGLFFSFLSFKYGFIQTFNYNLLKAPLFYHLWYFYPLLLIYAISYFIRVRDNNTSMFLFSSFFLLFFVFCNPFTSNILEVFFDYQFDNYFFINGEFFYYLLYALIGALLRGTSFSKKDPLLFLFGYIVVCVLIAFGTSNLHNTMLYSYLNPMVAFSAICLFLFIKNTPKKNGIFSRFLGMVSNYSLGVYCTHAFVLLILEKVFNIKSINPMYGIVVFSFLVLFISMFFSYCIRIFDKKGYIS